MLPSLCAVHRPCVLHLSCMPFAAFVQCGPIRACLGHACTAGLVSTCGLQVGQLTCFIIVASGIPASACLFVLKPRGDARRVHGSVWQLRIRQLLQLRVHLWLILPQRAWLCTGTVWVSPHSLSPGHLLVALLPSSVPAAGGRSRAQDTAPPERGADQCSSEPTSSTVSSHGRAD